MAFIRVRFAPSPTGSMHLGSLRTALYNYMFSRSTKGGRFILRIEDTDQQRIVSGAVESLVQDLEWLGIKPDEGPLSGPFGPYIQSHRLSLYKKYAFDLLEKGSAYRCFCTEKTLELMRKEALRRRETPRYDNRCRNLSSKEINNRLKSGDEHVIRFKLRDFSKPWHDIIYGDITHNVADIEGDPVILKRDGFPTYHLANVIDDHLMEISHVLRGAEWQTSTPKHLMLFEAFGWKPPAYAHLPLLLNKDGTKLSKRQNDLSVASLRQDGLFPEALNCFVLQMGGHFAHSVNDCFDLPALAEKRFRLDKIGSQFARIDFDRLYDLNRDVMQMKITTNIDSMVSEAALLIKHHHKSKPTFEQSSVEPMFLKQLLTNHFKHRLRSLKDLLNEEYNFIWLQPKSSNQSSDAPAEIANHKDQLCKIVFDSFTKEEGFAELSSNLRAYTKANSLQFNAVMRELRLALTDRAVGLPIGEVAQILGFDRTKHRLDLYWK